MRILGFVREFVRWPSKAVAEFMNSCFDGLGRPSYISIGCCLLALAGCAAPGIFNSKQAEIPRADAAKPAVRVLCIWEPAEGRGVDGLPTRGFAGQAVFLTRTMSSPVQVDGEVRIYLFDDQGTTEDQAKPIHQFDFKGDAWTMHLHNGTLGPSYHVFIPYTRKGTFQAQAALRLRMKPTSGPVIFSDMVNVTLPGPVRKPASQSNSTTKPQDVDRSTSRVDPRGMAMPTLAARKPVLSNADARIKRTSYKLGTLSRQADVAPRADAAAGAKPVTVEHVQSAALSGHEFQRFMDSSDGLRRRDATHRKRRFKMSPAASFDDVLEPEIAEHPLDDADAGFDEPAVKAERRESVLEFDDFFRTPPE